MNPLVRGRTVTTPTGFIERDCFLVSYRLPFFPHCFVLCHESGNDDHPQVDPAIMGFFMAQAHELSRRLTGNTQSFVAIHSGNVVRKRQNLHMHVFVMRRRWHKAWLYVLLATIHSVSAIRRGLLTMVGLAPGKKPRRDAA